MANPFLSGVLKAGATIGAPLERAGSAVARGVENVATLGTYEHPGASAAYVRSLPAMFDPRTRAGAANLAGILMGKPSALGQRYLDQLGGIVPLTEIKGPPGYPDNYHTMVPDPILTKPVPAVRANPTRTPTGEPTTHVSVEDTPELRQLRDLLGYTSGDPRTDLMNMLTKGYGNSFREVGSKLGIGGDTNAPLVAQAYGPYPKMPIPGTHPLHDNPSATLRALIFRMLQVQAIRRRN